MVFKNTINGTEPWEYLGVLNVCIRIMLTIFAGVFLTHSGVFDSKLFAPQAVSFVFYVALPSLVVQGLGINIDIYDDDFLWKFISAFLILRGIALVGSFIIVFRSETKRIGEVAVMWLATSWISTVILGVPICAAVFKNPKLGVTYGILAGISSFIFQLPVQLLFLECHRLEQEYLAQPTTTKNGHLESSQDVELATESKSDKICPEPQDLPMDEGGSTKELEMGSAKNLEMGSAKNLESDGVHPEDDGTHDSSTHNTPQVQPSSLELFLEFSKKREVWARILGQVIRNPVLIGIAVAFFLTITKLGPKYLNASSKDFVPGLAWIPQTLDWLGACVSPVSLLAMGMWMRDQGSQMFQISNTSAFWFMLTKLVLVPLVMVGLAKWLDFDDVAGRAAVLIAALPISQASFSLGSRYKIGEAILSENVALGTLFILPTILLWNLALDGFDIFPIPE